MRSASSFSFFVILPETLIVGLLYTTVEPLPPEVNADDETAVDIETLAFEVNPELKAEAAASASA